MTSLYYYYYYHYHHDHHPDETVTSSSIPISRKLYHMKKKRRLPCCTISSSSSSSSSRLLRMMTLIIILSMMLCLARTNLNTESNHIIIDSTTIPTVSSTTTTTTTRQGVVRVVTAWQNFVPIKRSTSFRRYHKAPYSTIDLPWTRMGRGRRTLSEFRMTMNENNMGNDDKVIRTMQEQTDNSINDILETASVSTTSTTSTTLIPANLRRKIQAKRPTLGHVVPYRYKQSQAAAVQQQQQQQTSTSTSSSSSGGSIPSQLQLQGLRREKVDVIHNKNNYLIKIMAGMARGRKLESPSTVYLRPMMGKVKEAIYSTLTSFGIYSTNNYNSYNGYSTTAIRHLDIFAGSGSVGLESLSRGATHCTFVDFSMDCCTCIQRNIDLTGLGTSTTTSTSNQRRMNDDTNPTKSTLVCCTDAMTALTDPHSVGVLSSSSQNGTPYQIITICPPYEEVVYGDLLEAVVGSDVVTEDTIVIIEYPIELLQGPKQKPNSSSPNPNNLYQHSYGMPHVIQSKSNTAIGIRNRKYGRTVIAFYIINPTGRYPDANSRPEEFVKPV